MKSKQQINVFVLAALLCAAHSAQAQEAAIAEPKAPTDGTEAVAAQPPSEAATEAAAAAEAAPATEAAPAGEAATAAAAAPATAEDPGTAATGAFSEKVAAAVGAPPEGKAHVVFFRPSKFVGSAIGFKVRENDVELGKLRNGNYFVLAVEPGVHAYVVHSEAKDVTNIEAEAGETYFLSASISMGVMAGRPNLSPSDAAAFEAALGKLKKTPAL